MTFGISRGVAVDASGNLQDHVWVEVRRQLPGFPMAIPIYADADGVAALDNPFQSLTGEFAFYAVGGTYRVRVYKPGFDKTWDDVPIGTAQAADVDAYARAGFTWAPESATATPPSNGCIRFDTADVSLSAHVYLDKQTLGNSTVTSWLQALSLGDWLMLSTGVGIEVGWSVVSVTVQAAYVDIQVDHTSYAGPVGPLSFGDSGFVTVSQERQGDSSPGTDLTIAAAGTYAVANTVARVFVSLAAPGQVNLTLGKTADRNNISLIVADVVGNATIVLTPDAADTGGINGGATAQINSSGAGFGLAGGATFYPKASLLAWIGIA